MKNLRSILKKRYGLAVGEKTLEEIKARVAELLRTEFMVGGRSFATGRKKIIKVLLSDFS